MSENKLSVPELMQHLHKLTKEIDADIEGRPREFVPAWLIITFGRLNRLGFLVQLLASALSEVDERSALSEVDERSALSEVDERDVAERPSLASGQPTAGHLEPFLQAGDAAREAGVTTSGIHRAAESGRLPVASVTASGTRLFRRSDVLVYASQRRARGGAH